MRRILQDEFRQLRWVWLVMLLAFTIGGLWLFGRPTGAGRQANYAALAADLMGVLSMSSATDALRMWRWVFTVPVRRRDIGRGLWLLNVIVPASLTVGAKVLIVALGSLTSVPSAFNFRWVASSGIFNLAFAGSVCWLLIQLVKPERRAVPQWLTWVACLAGLAALGWSMPTVGSSWNWPVGGVLGSMLALTVGGYRQSERLATNGGSLGLLTGGPSDSGTRTSVPAARMAFDHRLSGPRRMLWSQFRTAALVQFLFMSLVTVMGAVPFVKGQSLTTQFVQTWSDMDPDVRSMVWAIGWILYFSIGMRRWQVSSILVMRALPMSAREINQLLLLRPIVSWLAWWLVALPFLSIAAPAGYTWLGIGTLITAMGVTSLASAALLRWHRLPLTILAVMAVNYLLIFGHPWKYVHTSAFSTTVGQFALLALGVAGLRVAYVWQARLLTTSSALYRRM